MAIGGPPVTVIASGGLPVTDLGTAGATPYTVIAAGGMPVTLTTSPKALPLSLLNADGTFYGGGDIIAPTILTVALSSSAGADLYYTAGDVVSATVTFSETVNVTGTPQLTLTVGASAKTANYASGTGTAALVFSYTIAGGDNDSNGISIGANALALNSGTIKDAAGNNATLTHSSVADNASHKVDTTAPTIINTFPADDATSIAVNVNGTVLFSENVQFHSIVDISLRKTTDDSVVQAFTAADIAGAISISADTLTINPTSDYANSTGYYYLIGSTSIKDMAGNFFAGITSKTTWNFTTASGAATVIFLTAGATWSVPANWNNANNTIEAIGAGGGTPTSSASNSTAGGGGGAYAKEVNVSLTQSSTVDIQVGTSSLGNAGTASWLKNNGGTKVVEALGGAVGGNPSPAGAGGTAAGSTGSTKYSGGAGAETPFGYEGGGGGGAAGLTANGKNGAGDPNGDVFGGGGGGGAGGASSSDGSRSLAANTGGPGGQGPAGTGSGAGGLSADGSAGTLGGGGGGGGNSNTNGGAGGSSVAWTQTSNSATAGPGGGGGGGSQVGGDGGAGANYGGGAGGGGYGLTALGAAGGQGIIVITYTP